MTTTPRRAAAWRVETRLPVVLTGIAAVASLVAVGGGTVARLVLAIAMPAGVGIWMHDTRQSRPPVVVLVAIGLFMVAGFTHVVFTSPAATWVVDGHMVRWGLLPSGSARIAVAWAVPLLWAALFAAVAVTAHRHLDTPLVAPLILSTGAAPLITINAFPMDAYLLLWDSTALGHPAYAVGTCALLVLAWVAGRGSRDHDRSDVRVEVVSPTRRDN